VNITRVAHVPELGTVPRWHTLVRYLLDAKIDNPAPNFSRKMPYTPRLKALPRIPDKTYQWYYTAAPRSANARVTVGLNISPSVSSIHAA